MKVRYSTISPLKEQTRKMIENGSRTTMNNSREIWIGMHCHAAKKTGQIIGIGKQNFKEHVGSGLRMILKGRILRVPG